MRASEQASVEWIPRKTVKIQNKQKSKERSPQPPVPLTREYNTEGEATQKQHLNLGNPARPGRNISQISISVSFYSNKKSNVCGWVDG